MRYLTLLSPTLLLPVLLMGCVTTQPVDKPCGVINDSLQNVNSNTRKGNERLAVHFERGRSAGCWTRTGHLPVLADPVSPVSAPTVMHGRSNASAAPMVASPVADPVPGESTPLPTKKKHRVKAAIHKVVHAFTVLHKPRTKHQEITIAPAPVPVSDPEPVPTVASDPPAPVPAPVVILPAPSFSGRVMEHLRSGVKVW